MTQVSITIGAAQDRHYSPADPPHTKAYSTINRSRSPAAPTEREQATGYLGFINYFEIHRCKVDDYEVVLNNKSHSAANPILAGTH